MEQEHNMWIIDGKWYKWNPKADGNKGHWFVMNPQPGEKQAAPAANVAGSMASQATTTVPTSLVPLVPSPHTSYVIPDTSALTEMMSLSRTPGGSVAQVSADAACKEAKKQALVAQIQCDQAKYTKHMEDLAKLE